VGARDIGSVLRSGAPTPGDGSRPPEAPPVVCLPAGSEAVATPNASTARLGDPSLLGSPSA